MASSAFSQARQNTLDLIKKGDLKGALSSAQAVADKTKDAGDYQIEGLLLAAAGKFQDALKVFISGLTHSKRALSPTGLETLPAGNVLAQKLAVVKGIYALSNSEASFRNNIGLTRLMLGQMKDGFGELGLAQQMNPNWGAPHVNESVGHLLKGEGSKAVAASQKASNLNETSATARAVFAEANLKVNRTGDAKDQLDAALSQAPKSPVALSAMAKYSSQTGDFRNAQRYQSQAMAAGPVIATDGVVGSTYNNTKVSGGSANEQHYSLDQRMLKPDGFGLKVNVYGDKQRVANEGNAFQTNTGTGIEWANKVASVHLDYQDLGGGRPGATVFEPGVTSDPSAVVAFRQTNLYGDYHLGPFLLHAGVRRSNTSIADTGNSNLGFTNDSQVTGELRYDLTKLGGKNSVGYAFTNLHRDQMNDLVIDPTEELLPPGTTKQWSAYVLHTRQLNPLMTLNAGGVLGNNGRRTVFMPTLDLGIQLGPKNLLHLGVSSNFNSGVSDLMPDALKADAPLDNNIDRNQETTTNFNRQPVLLGQEGRQQTYQINMATTIKKGLTLNSNAFHHEFKDFAIQGTDPQTATFLNENTLASGHATGLSETLQLGVSRHSSVRMNVTAQTTRMGPNGTLFNGSNPGAPVPLNLPFFAGASANIGFDMNGNDWTGTLIASTIGRRTVATAVPVGNTGQQCCLYIQTVNPITAWNLYLHKQYKQYNIYATFYNLTKVSFYPGVPGRTTIVAGFRL